MSEFVPRRKTRPEIKWLANEIAATRGELERLDEELRLMQERKIQLQATYAAMSQVAAQLGALELPTQVPTVRAHDVRYGGRGRLSNWVKETLRTAYPEALDTLLLLELTVQEFELSFSAPKARTRYNDNVFRPLLKRLLSQGLLEKVEVQGLSKTGWRWKAEAPTLAELRVQESRVQDRGLG